LRVPVVEDESLLAGSLRTWDFSTNNYLIADLQRERTHAGEAIGQR
jgi:hypothetical protein